MTWPKLPLPVLYRPKTATALLLIRCDKMAGGNAAALTAVKCNARCRGRIDKGAGL